MGLSRSSFYYHPTGETEENLTLMRLMDEQHLKTPFYGSREMTQWLKFTGYAVNRKRVRRLMRVMRLEAVYPKPRTTRRCPEHKVFPYLLRDLAITRPNQVWSTDITYVPMQRGYMYLVAVMDWYSRYVISWRISNSLDIAFCLDCLEEALADTQPEIFNSDQGSQFTSPTFTALLEARNVAISMNGRGRALDNVLIERLWRTVKYENIYLNDYASGWELEQGLAAYFNFYRHERFHSSLSYRTPATVYHAGA